MELKPSEISALIKKQIENYDNKIVADDVGTIVKIGDGIAIIQGLANAMSSELLLFPNDDMENVVGGSYGDVVGDACEEPAFVVCSMALFTAGLYDC